MDIIFIRHTSVNVPKGTCYGRTDVPLNDTFEQEAAVTKKNLMEYGKFDAVFSSPLTRTRKLAEYCGYPSPTIDNRLKEMSMGDWEMRKFDEIKDKELQEWYDDYMHAAPKTARAFLCCTPVWQLFLMRYASIATNVSLSLHMAE